MSDFDSAWAAHDAAQEAAAREFAQREAQAQLQGGKNVAAFIRKMEEHGIQARPIPRGVVRTEKTTWLGKKKTVERWGSYPLPGWSARVHWEERSADWVDMWILADGSVWAVAGRGLMGYKTSPAAFNNAEGLMLHARWIIQTGDACHAVNHQ
jgi:hypothetical protein